MALEEITTKPDHLRRSVTRLAWDRLEKGDEVAYISSRSYYGEDVTMYTVDRTTATLIIMTDGSRWYRKNGQRQAGSSMNALLHPLDDRVITAQQEKESRVFKRTLEDLSKRKTTSLQQMLVDADDASKICASFRARILILEGKRRAADPV